MTEREYDEQEVRNHILLLIDVDDTPVQGKTLFMYQMFLVFKELPSELHIPFFPYQFGPYSNIVAHECNWLIENKFVDAKKKGRSWMFELTDKGKSFASTLPTNTISTGEEKRSQISRVKKHVNSLGLPRTIEFLKSHYPAYFKNARV